MCQYEIDVRTHSWNSVFFCFFFSEGMLNKWNNCWQGIFVAPKWKHVSMRRMCYWDPVTHFGVRNIAWLLCNFLCFPHVDRCNHIYCNVVSFSYLGISLFHLFSTSDLVVCHAITSQEKQIGGSKSVFPQSTYANFGKESKQTWYVVSYLSTVLTH